MSEKLPKDWKRVKLGEIAELSTHTWKVGGEKLPYIGLEHIDENRLRINSIGSSDDVSSNKFIFTEKEFLFGKLRPYFRKLYNPTFKGICSTDIWVVRPKENVDKNFLFYLFATREFIDLSYNGASGTRMPRADWKFVKNSEWIIPEDINEQRAIAEVLSSLDDKIDLLHRQNQTLEQIAQTLFRKWFIEDAKEEWEEVKLGNLINISSGKGLKKEDYSENGLYPVLGANGEIGRTNKFLYDEKLIFTGRVGTLGKVFISEGKVWLSDNTLIIIPKEEEFFYFTYFYLKTQELENLNVGSTQPLIRQSDIYNLEVQTPKRDIILNFNLIIQYLFSKILKNKEQIRTLENLRDTLLPKLMSGEVRVK